MALLLAEAANRMKIACSGHIHLSLLSYDSPPSFDWKTGLLRLRNYENGAIIRLYFFNHQVQGKERASFYTLLAGSA
jgi:hypothetical protein